MAIFASGGKELDGILMLNIYQNGAEVRSWSCALYILKDIFHSLNLVWKRIK